MLLRSCANGCACVTDHHTWVWLGCHSICHNINMMSCSPTKSKGLYMSVCSMRQVGSLFKTGPDGTDSNQPSLVSAWRLSVMHSARIGGNFSWHFFVVNPKLYTKYQHQKLMQPPTPPCMGILHFSRFGSCGD